MDDEFQIIVVETPKVRVEIPRDKLLSFMKLIEELRWDKSEIKRYVNVALRLRKLEREVGKSYTSLIRDYNRLSSEEVKLRYSIEQLAEKRKRLEEDLNLYLEQHKLTFELVGKLIKLLNALKEKGLDVGDLENTLNAIEALKKMNYDVREVIKVIQDQRDLKSTLSKLRDELENVKMEIQRLHERKQEVLSEIGEIHGISGELEELKKFKHELESEVRRVEERLNEAKTRLGEVNAELEKRLGQKASLEELDKLVEELKTEVERLRSEKERISAELSELLGIQGGLEEIREKIEEKRKALEELEREVSSREAYIGILEGELSAAHAMLRIFTDPQGADVEDLETLVDQLQRIIKIKRGELSALKPLEHHLLNRFRENIVSLILPYIKGEFVPKKVFEQLEREVKKLNERRMALEEELASLKKLLEGRREEHFAAQPPRESGIEAFTPDGNPVELKNLDKGKKFRIVCPSCKNSVITSIPPRDELEELASNNCRLVFTCGKCGKAFDVSIQLLLKKVEG